MIHTLKPYPAMKDSGVSWLGQVSECWEVGWFHADIITLEKKTDGLLDEIIGGDSR